MKNRSIGHIPTNKELRVIRNVPGETSHYRAFCFVINWSLVSNCCKILEIKRIGMTVQANLNAGIASK